MEAETFARFYVGACLDESNARITVHVLQYWKYYT